ncbi:hypothetical protein LC593_05540 [Nostoc sp. CHAB 5844]|nr:hypothetical protein [Nostoc sp. CHAB 5844]
MTVILVVALDNLSERAIADSHFIHTHYNIRRSHYSTSSCHQSAGLEL